MKSKTMKKIYDNVIVNKKRLTKKELQYINNMVNKKINLDLCELILKKSLKLNKRQHLTLLKG